MNSLEMRAGQGDASFHTCSLREVNFLLRSDCLIISYIWNPQLRLVNKHLSALSIRRLFQSVCAKYVYFDAKIFSYYINSHVLFVRLFLLKISLYLRGGGGERKIRLDKLINSRNDREALSWADPNGARSCWRLPQRCRLAPRLPQAVSTELDQKWSSWMPAPREET